MLKWLSNARFFKVIPFYVVIPEGPYRGSSGVTSKAPGFPLTPAGMTSIPYVRVGFLIFGLSASAFPATQQQLIPITREIRTSSTPSVLEWNAFVRVADYRGAAYVSLVQ